MKIPYALALTSYVMLYSIGISSGSQPITRDFISNFGSSNEDVDHEELSSRFECLTNEESASSAPRCRSFFTPDRSNAPEKSIHAAESSLRARSRSPSARTHPRKYPYSNIFRFELADIGLVRLIPNNNPFQRFKMRIFIFPPNKTVLEQAVGRNNYKPIPTDERLVVTTDNGDVIATVERNSYLRGIFNHNGKRIGLKADSGAVFELPPDIVNETPIGNRVAISKNFKITQVNMTPATGSNHS